MRRAAQSSSPRPRTRRKTADTSTAEAPPAPASTPEPARNVGSVEALLSLTVGMLMVVAALVPRTFRQLFLLGFGGALAYRGLTGECGLYRRAGIDTNREALLPQIGRKLEEASQD